MTTTDSTTAPPATTCDRAVHDARILIVDDEPVVVKILRRHLRDAGYRNFITTSNPAEAEAMVRRERPDVVLLDYLMPEVDGLQVLSALRDVVEHTPILMLTASTEASTKVAAFELGVTDFLNKPVDPTELAARIRSAVVVKDLTRSREEIVHCLGRAADFRDRETPNHAIRIGRYARIMARHLGFDEPSADELELAAQLHDIGKIGISDEILDKSDALDDDEMEILHSHCAIGKDIIRPQPQGVGSSILEMAARIALTHHERWDGTGYPLGLAGERIPIEGRITAVADEFDALSAKRPNRTAYPREKCFELLEEGRGTKFDPAVLDAFRACLQSIVDVQMQFADLDQ
jgi:putative two-component system response regulator